MSTIIIPPFIPQEPDPYMKGVQVNQALVKLGHLKYVIDQINDELANLPAGTVLSVTGLDTDNTNPTNPVVKISVDGITITGDGTPGNPLIATGGGGGGTIYVKTAAQAQTDLQTFTQGSQVFITDADKTNGGALFSVIKDPISGIVNLAPDGTGLFLNAAINSIGDTSGVLAETGVAPTGNTGGVWNAIGEGAYVTGDLVVWNNSNYQLLDSGAVNGTDPATNTTAYYFLNKSISNVGYLLVANKIKGYELASNHFKFREDQVNECEINHWSYDFHQWGDTNIRVKMEDGSTFYSDLNCTNTTIRLKITARYSNIINERGNGIGVFGEIGGVNHSFDHSDSSGDNVLVLDISGDGHFIDGTNDAVSGTHTLTLTGYHMEIYFNDSTGSYSRTVTSDGINGYHDYSSNSGAKIFIQATGDSNHIDAYSCTAGSQNIVMTRTSNGYDGSSGSGSVVYYLDNSSFVSTIANTGDISGRIYDSSFAVYACNDVTPNAGTVMGDNIFGGFNGNIGLKNGFSVTARQLSDNTQSYTLPDSISYSNQEVLSNSQSTFELEYDAQANYVPNGNTPKGELTITGGNFMSSFAGIYKLTTEVQGTAQLNTVSNDFTVGQNIAFKDVTTAIIGTALIVAFDTLTSIVTFSQLVTVDTDLLMATVVSCTDGTETALLSNGDVSGGLITSINGDIAQEKKFGIYSGDTLINSVQTDKYPSALGFGNIATSMDLFSQYVAIASITVAPQVVLFSVTKDASNQLILTYDGTDCFIQSETNLIIF